MENNIRVREITLQLSLIDNHIQQYSGQIKTRQGESGTTAAERQRSVPAVCPEHAGSAEIGWSEAQRPGDAGLDGAGCQGYGERDST